MLPLHKVTNHFRVTCPFWTRFMLKPTVGIELGRMVSNQTFMQHFHGKQYSIVNSPPWKVVSADAQEDDNIQDRTYG
jgi:hypothetical protein